MIKKLFFYIFLLCATNKAAHTQIIQLHGFTQQLYGGASRESIIDEKKNISGEAKKTQDRFFLFAEINKNKTIKIKQVWINRSYFLFRLDTVRSFPVVQYPFTANDTLIGNSVNKVLKFELIKDPANIQVASAFLRKKIKENSVVVVYQMKRRKCYATLKSLKKLNPIFAP